MIKIKPFQALMPAPGNAQKIACPPYDVVSREEAATIAAGNPLCFFHVTRAEIDLPPDTDPHSELVYLTAAARFEAMKRGGAFVRDAEPCLYVYRMDANGHTQTGLAACCSVEDYRIGAIKRHELTRFDKEQDRTRHIMALRAHSGPVLLAYPERPDIEAALAAAEKDAPLFDVTARDGVRHRVWRASGLCAELAAMFEQVPAAYIADGHHRAAASLSAAETLRAAGGAQASGSEWFLAVLFSADKLRVLPYNRCVRDLNGLSKREFLAAVESVFKVSRAAGGVPTRPGQAAMFFDGEWRILSWDEPATDDPVARLDVSVLQELLLRPVLGIEDPRSSRRIEFIGGSRGAAELESMVRSGRAAVAFALYPVSVRQIMAVSDAGRTMPPKSTWFDPKPLSGLLIHDFG